MAGYGSFYKGEKKKKRKDEKGKQISFAPVFIPPKIAPKGKKEF